ncbi:MAG: F0F1 ATP synthase subunit B [Candidatus Omnitrophota bacterium]|jgi:F-type H+-transporting ATPase subunit b
MDFFTQNIIPGEVVVQLVAFLIVFGVLKMFAWKPVMKSLEERRLAIQKTIAAAEAVKLEVEKLRADYNAHLQKIDEEARAKIQEAVDDGRRISREIQQKARAEASETLEKAKENLDLEVAKARITLQRTIADLSLRVAEKILRENLSEPRQQEKVLEIIKELETGL